ncbi:MAG: hypothetical protein AAGB34_01670 [Planctomycetota bacterium]
MKTAFAVALVAGAAAAANAAVVASWSADDVDDAASSPALTADANVTALDLTRGPGISINTAGSTFNSRNWTDGDLAAAVADGDFLSFGVTVDAGYQLDLTTLDIRLDRSGTGPDDFAIMLWGGDLGSSTTVLTHDYQDSGSGVTFNDVDLTGLGTLTGTVEFRVYAFNAENTTGTGTFDVEQLVFPGDDTTGIVLNGDVSLIPTPGSAALLGLAGFAAARRRRNG